MAGQALETFTFRVVGWGSMSHMGTRVPQSNATPESAATHTGDPCFSRYSLGLLNITIMFVNKITF